MDRRVLEIDHVNGDGFADPRRSSREYYRRVVRAFETGDGRFQVLCANCHQIKTLESGEHHQRRVVIGVLSPTPGLSLFETAF